MPGMTATALASRDDMLAGIVSQPSTPATTNAPNPAEAQAMANSDAPVPPVSLLVPSDTAPAGTPPDMPATSLSPQPMVTPETNAPMIAEPMPAAVSQASGSTAPATAQDIRSHPPSGTAGADNGVRRSAQQSVVASSASATRTIPNTLADTLQRMTSMGAGDIAVSRDASPAASPEPRTVETDRTPSDVPDSIPLPGIPEAQIPIGVDPAGAGLSSPIAGPGSPIPQRPAREAASSPASERTASPSADPQMVAASAIQVQAAPASGAAPLRSPQAASAPTHSVAEQIAPAMVSMAQSHATNGRLSISVAPDALGQVHITVERATDGTTSIHVAAEQLATLDLLRHDQDNLNRALDQAGVGSQGHTLSFSWDGSGGGMSGWGNPGRQPGDHLPADPATPYADETTPTASVAAAARGGIDVTA
jgi:flagellar hook-length control protein FliK